MIKGVQMKTSTATKTAITQSFLHLSLEAEFLRGFRSCFKISVRHIVFEIENLVSTYS